MDKAALIGDRMSGKTGTVEIQDGETIRVRGLSRYEMVQATKIEDQLAQERYILALAVMDPRLTEDEIEQWQKGSPPEEINRVAAAINELSGIGQGAQKS